MLNKTFFFGEGCNILLMMLRVIWQKTVAIKNEAIRLKEIFQDDPILPFILLIIDLITFPIIVSIILIFFGLGSFLFAILLAFGMFFSWLAILILRFIDKIIANSYRLIWNCPICQGKFKYTFYICPKCGNIHHELRPSIYGILNKKCNCGNLLPTTIIGGRGNLQAVCPVCGNILKDSNIHTELVIAVIGGKSSGKTCFINMSIAQIKKWSMAII